MTFVPFNKAQHGDVTFLNETYIPLAIKKLKECKASRVFIHQSVFDYMNRNGTINNQDILVPSNNPKLAFIQELGHSIGRTTNSQSKVEIGNNTTVMKGTSITHTTIGDNCIIYPNCTLGYPALALERDESGKLYDFEHIGRLDIGDNVRLGPLTNVARGTLTNTIVEDNVRTDAHVNIAHNCHIGNRAILAVGVILGGSIDIGHDSWIGLNAEIREHTTIGNNALVGMGAVVIDDVADNDIVAGCPAVSIKHKVTLSNEKRYMMVGY